MSFLNGISIRSRLAVGYITLVALVLMVAAMSIRSLSLAHRGFEHQVMEIGRVRFLGNAVLDAANARAVAARNLVLSSDEQQSEQRFPPSKKLMKRWASG